MRLQRGTRYTLIGVAVVVILLALLVVVFTRTEYGVERSGRLAVEQIRRSINGDLEVERITSGSLIAGVTLHGVTLDDPDGRPFLSADSARLAYRFRTLLGGAFVFDRLILHSPEVVLEMLPGQAEWNYERIFPPDTTDTAGASLVLISDLRVSDGHVTVRAPWEPEGPVTAEDTARLILESVPGGLVRTMRFTEVNGSLSRIVWEAPGEEGRLVEVEELATRAYIYEDPLEIESATGVVVIRDSVVSFEAPRVRLPQSELALVGTVTLHEEQDEYDIQIDGRNLALADFQWLYPPLPRDGRGDLQLRIQSQGPRSILWLAQDAHIRADGSELSGSFGVVTGDTLYFTNVALEASPLDLDLLQRLVPAELPLEGLLIGTVEIEGPISALETRGDVRLRTFRDGTGAESELRWNGTVSGERPYRVRGVTADVRGLNLEQVAQFAPGLRLRGTATGRVRATGSLEHGLDLTGDLALQRDGRRSAVRGSGRFGSGGSRSAFDLRLEAEPVSMDLVAEQFPGLRKVAGEARGPIRMMGTLDDFRLEADLMTPAGGVLLEGRFALQGPNPRYRAEGTVSEFRLDRLVPELPETWVTGRFDLDGAGDRPGTLDGRATLEVHSAWIAGLQIQPSTLRGTVSEGLLRLDSAVVATDVGELIASGAFGLVPGRRGELAVTARAADLGPLEPLFFPAVTATPLAERDFATGLMGERPVGERLGSGVAERLGGMVDAELVVEGSIHDWSVRGRAAGRDLLYDGVAVGAAEADFDGGRDSITVDASVDSVAYEHRRLPHARATVGWSPSGGRVVAVAVGVGPQRLDMEGSFERNGDDLDLRLRQLSLETADGRWGVADTVHARIGLDGLQIDSLVLLRKPRYARIRMTGSLPWRRPGEQGPLRASMVVNLDSVRIGEVLRLAQSDTAIDGVVSGELRVTGTALAPTMAGRIMARPFRYGGAVLDSAGWEIGYADRRIHTRFAGWEGGDPILAGSGTVPIDLALTDRANRLLDEPLDLRIEADSVPAGLVSFLAPGFRDVTGTVDGSLAIVGTVRDPGLEGELHLVGGAAFFEPLNVRYTDMNATARMGAGRLIEVEGRIATGEGSGQVLGTLDLTGPRDPDLDLAVTARELNATRRRDVAATVTGWARVTGSYVRPIITGDVRILGGEMNLDEVWRQYQIVQLDPALFHLFDTTAVSFRPQAEIPFLDNLVLTNTTITADRSFWLRSRELNVEVSGRLDLEVDRQQLSDLRLTGSLQALGGNYTLQLAQGVPGRTFAIRSGTIEFLGTPGVDPDLNMAAAYTVRRAQGDPIHVLAQVTGTLKDPRVALTSDSDLPLSESDLASYILFGRSGAELTQAESDVLTSGIGLMRPVATGMLSNMARGALAWTGVVDYVAFTTPEYGLDAWTEGGLRGVLHNTQLEIGIDAGRDVSLVVSGRLPTDQATVPAAALWRQVGARVEWRFYPTWTTELYVEDRFARTPSFGLTEIDDRKVWGLSLVRDWGY